MLAYALGWGVALWLIGYLLSIVLFAFVPAAQIGWIIMPVGILITLVVLLRLGWQPIQWYLTLSIVWTSIAIIFDYLFIVRVFAPADGYYKLDVFLYYVLTFALPLAVGAWRQRVHPVVRRPA